MFDLFDEKFVRGLIRRDRDTIRMLSPTYFWQFTRRHPYYLSYQPWAKAYRDQHALDAIAESDRWKVEFAVEVLQDMLSWVGPPFYDPANNSAADNELESNAGVSTTTYRNHFLALLHQLPWEVRRVLAVYFSQNHEDGTQLWELSRAVRALPYRELDEIMERSVIFDPQVPMRSLLDGFEKIVKGQQSPSPSRRRVDSTTLDEYLAVWDQREGWHDGSYDGLRERRLRDIAQESQSPLATVQNRYRSAFKHITGQDYEPRIWGALFFPIKLNASKFGGWRNKKLRGSNVILRSAKSIRAGRGNDDQAKKAGTLELADPISDPTEYASLISDITSLFKQDKTNEEIVNEFDFKNKELGLEAIQWLRERDDDGLLSI